MQFSLAVLGLAASLVSAMPQGVTQSISPPESAPQGCQTSFPDSFSITTVNVSESSSQKMLKRQTNPQYVHLIWKSSSDVLIRIAGAVSRSPSRMVS